MGEESFGRRTHHTTPSSVRYIGRLPSSYKGYTGLCTRLSPLNRANCCAVTSSSAASMSDIVHGGECGYQTNSLSNLCLLLSDYARFSWVLRYTAAVIAQKSLTAVSNNQLIHITVFHSLTRAFDLHPCHATGLPFTELGLTYAFTAETLLEVQLKPCHATCVHTSTCRSHNQTMGSSQRAIGIVTQSVIMALR